jgi:GGDEF domain-containing protein
VDIWDRATLRSLLVPGALVFAATAVLLGSGWLPLAPSAVNLAYYAVFGGGLVLAARFHSSRVFFALIVLFLANRALEFFASPGVSSGTGRIALEAVSFLIPLTFVLFSFVRERGLGVNAMVPRLALVFVESVFVAAICRPDENSAPFFLHPAILNPHWFRWSHIPQFSWILFAGASVVLLARFLLYRSPVESGLLWSLAAFFLGLQSGAIGVAPRAYVAAAGLILLSSIIENSYVLAYHDELTTLPARRAFNDALQGLENPYAIAAVDIDHFKSFNDTYGHDIGDQVLCMVATKLSKVTGGGHAYRVGGEEFCILFPGKSTEQVAEHLELLRETIEAASFRVRRQSDRRGRPHGPDRRRSPQKKITRMRPAPNPPSIDELSVTVSIGAAESSPQTREPNQVIRAADQALYRAKGSGRNRVEVAPAGRTRARRSA